MVIRIEKTLTKENYNLIDDEKDGDDRYIKQLSRLEVKELGRSIIDCI